MRTRETLALLTAPLASGLLQGAVMGNAGAMVFALMGAYLFAAVIGLPALFILKRSGGRTLGAHLLAGSAAGTACGVVLGLLVDHAGFNARSIVAGMLFFALHGFVVSLAYWLVAHGFTGKAARTAAGAGTGTGTGTGTGADSGTGAGEA